MAFNFGKVKVTASKKDVEFAPVTRPLQFKSGSGDIAFVMGEFIPLPFSKAFPQIKDFIDKAIYTYAGNRKVGYSIYCGLATKCATVVKPLENDVYDTYARNSWSNEVLKTSIEENSVQDCPFVFSVGRGLYSITKTGDLQANYFYDAAFNKTYFYSPALDKFVFPIDNFSMFLRKVKMNFKPQDPRDTYIYQKVAIGTDPNTIVADVMAANYAQYQLQYALSHWDQLHEELKYLRSWGQLTYKASESPLHSKQILKDILDSRNPLLAYDLETSGFDFMNNRIGDLSLANTRNEGLYIPWKHVIDDYETASLFLKANEDKETIGANLKFDIKFIRRALEVKGDAWAKLAESLHVTYDVNQAGHLLNEMRSNSLKTLSWLYTPYGGYDEPLQEYKRIHPWVKNYLDIPDEYRIPYSAHDSAVTYGVHEEQMKHLDRIANTLDKEDRKAYTLKKYYTDILMPVTNMFIDIEYEGLYVDIDEMLRNEVEMKTIISKLEGEIKQELFSEVDLPPGFDFDLSSPTQLGLFLENHLLWPELGRTKAKHYQVGDDQLRKWENMGYKVAKKISEYRSWNVALKTFTGSVDDEDGWWQYVRKHEDGTNRIHADFMPGRADSGRNRCTRPNLQNIPARGAISKKVKKVICPPNEDFYIASVDFDSLQLKLATIQSRDPVLTEFYTNLENKIDLHSLTTHKIFGSRLFDVTVLEVTDSNNKVHSIPAKEKIKVFRKDGADEILSAMEYSKNMLEGDEIEFTNY